jgi:predicted membrane channel-forming protein YqfA (hemolysin III family)
MVFAGLAKTPIKKTVLLVSLGNAVVASVYTVMGAVFRSSEEFTGILFLVCFALSVIFILIPIFKNRNSKG